MSNGCCLEILIIEDEEGLCDMAEFVASDLGCRVKKAYNLKEASAIIDQDDQIHLGLFDYHLPDSRPDSGWNLEFLEKIRSRKNFEFLFVTGDMALTLEKAKEMGAADILFKPFTCEELQSLVVAYIQRKRQSICSKTGDPCPAIQG